VIYPENCCDFVIGAALTLHAKHGFDASMFFSWSSYWPAFLFCVSHVVFLRANKKMIRIDAHWVVALVAQVLSSAERLNEFFVYVPVRWFVSEIRPSVVFVF